MNDRMLGKMLYAIFWTNVPDIDGERFRAVLGDHLAFLGELERRGVLFASGPLRQPEGAPKSFSGMTIVRAAGFDEVEALVAEEPFTRAGLRTHQILLWTLNEGSFSVTLRFGQGTYDVG